MTNPTVITSVLTMVSLEIWFRWDLMKSPSISDISTMESPLEDLTRLRAM